MPQIRGGGGSGSGGSSSLTIGSAVSGGAANAVLYENASQNLAADGTNFTYDATNKLLQVGSALTVGLAGTSSGSIVIGEASSINNKITIGGTVSQTMSGLTNAVGSTWQIVTDTTGSGGGAAIRVGSTGVIGVASSGTATSVSSAFSYGGAANTMALGSGAAGDFSGTLKLTLLNVASGGSTTISTGVGSVKMSTANAATNTSWIPIAYAGTTYYVPAWTTNAP